MSEKEPKFQPLTLDPANAASPVHDDVDFEIIDAFFAPLNFTEGEPPWLSLEVVFKDTNPDPLDDPEDSTWVESYSCGKIKFWVPGSGPQTPMLDDVHGFDISYRDLEDAEVLRVRGDYLVAIPYVDDKGRDRKPFRQWNRNWLSMEWLGHLRQCGFTNWQSSVSATLVGLRGHGEQIERRMRKFKGDVNPMGAGSGGSGEAETKTFFAPTELFLGEEGGGAGATGDDKPTPTPKTKPVKGKVDEMNFEGEFWDTLRAELLISIVEYATSHDGVATRANLLQLCAKTSGGAKDSANAMKLVHGGGGFMSDSEQPWTWDKKKGVQLKS